MSHLTVTALQLSPRLSSAAFDTAFGELSAARVAYEDAPRNAEDVLRLTRASARLFEARRRMHTTLHGRPTS